MNDQPAVSHARPACLRGGWLLVARVTWIAIAVLTLVLLLAGLPTAFNQSLDPPPEYRDALRHFGLPAHFLATYLGALDVITLLAFFATAGVIFLLRSDDKMAIFTSLMLVTFGTNITQSVTTLAASQSTWHLPATLVMACGSSSLLAFIYIFPDGRFFPGWTRPAAIVFAVWVFASLLFPRAPFSPNAWPGPLGFLVQLGWYGSSVYVQAYRRKHLYSPVEIQQTKWVTYGLSAALLGFVILGLLELIPPPSQIHPLYLLYELAGNALVKLLLIMVPLSIAFSILHYRLWDIDVIIHRTLVYGVVMGVLGIGYFALVLVLQWIFQKLVGQQSDAAIVASTLIIASLFRPLSHRVQDLVDRRFYREKVNFQQAFADFSREVRAIIELPELLRALVNRMIDLLHITHGAVFLRDAKGTFSLAEARNLPSPAEGASPKLPPDAYLFLNRLQTGAVVSRLNEPIFPLLVPLIAPRAGKDVAPKQAQADTELVGVLALGPRLSGQGYSRDDQALLMGLADQAGTAIYVAQLITDKQAEARQKEQAERRLEAYRNSPVGRAAAFAQQLLAQPETALVKLHRLAQAAGRDPDAASLISNLPQVLGQQQDQDAVPASPEQDHVRAAGLAVAGLAEGFNYLFTSQLSPELLPLGLRTLVGVLPAFTPPAPPPTAEGTGPGEMVMEGAAEALAIYRLCQSALDANSIAQILQISEKIPAPSKEEEPPSAPFAELARGLAGLESVIGALHAHERVDTSQDKLAYLASAIERLRRVDRLARTELEGADRSVVRRIVESWLAIVTGAMGELQTRAQIVCRLLTRHTWVGDIISLALSLRNEGRGAALNLKVTLAPTPECTLLDDMAQVERLAPGEEAQVELRVRPRLAMEVDQFRARFVIQYADPRGPDQVENFADVIYLLAAEGEFQFIPNPYVVGTPLQPDSPLFFGRQDVVAFIQDNLASAHRNNLVLIGQRRTGKTSLLKQLPARLNPADYLPVYLDGQSLALDPGLPNFFLALATEIAFAVEDHGFSMDVPDLDDFAHSPAASFERNFLAQVRAVIGQRHVLLLLDEFEELEASVQRGNLDVSVFGFLRHLIQHSDNLSVIFCGTHRLEELSTDYWSVLFNISLYRQVAYLEQAEALRLIQEPVAGYGMRYDDLALDKIWRVTAGHPYFLQLLCHSLVNRHNKTERNYVTIADVNAALEDILASGEAHFVYLWADSTPEERLALTVLSRTMPLTGQAAPAQVLDYLVERGVAVEQRALGQALHRLALRDILHAKAGAEAAPGETYRWKLGLLGLWVEKYKSLSRVVDEVHP